MTEQEARISERMRIEIRMSELRTHIPELEGAGKADLADLCRQDIQSLQQRLDDLQLITGRQLPLF